MLALAPAAEVQEVLDGTSEVQLKETVDAAAAEANMGAERVEVDRAELEHMADGPRKMLKMKLAEAKAEERRKEAGYDRDDDRGRGRRDDDRGGGGRRDRDYY